jgi:signal transduction histidine kinase
MTPLHLPTAYFIAGILYLIMPISVWLMLRKRQGLSNILWCLGGLAFGLSLILLGMRGKWPDALTYEVAIWLLVLGPLLRVGALRHALQRSDWVTGLLALSLVHIAVYAVLNVILNHPSLRFVWSSLSAAAALAWLALLAREVYRRDQSVSAQWIFVCYLALAAVLVIRIPGVLLGVSEPTAMISDPLSNLLIFLGVLTAIVGNIGFLGMFIERMNRETLESAKVQARQEEATRLSQQIAQLDRRRSVGEIAASLAHELSQPLTNIYLISDRLALEVKMRNDHSLDMYFADMNRNVQSAGDILGRIRGFIRSKDIALERVEISSSHLGCEGPDLRLGPQRVGRHPGVTAPTRSGRACRHRAAVTNILERHSQRHSGHPRPIPTPVAHSGLARREHGTHQLHRQRPRPAARNK